MIDLKNRSSQKELLDGADIPFADIQKNMEELDSINRLLGGHKITIKGFKALSDKNFKKISVCEIGCGGGDNLRAIYQYCSAKNIEVQLTGIDMKQECIDFARQRNADMPANWICSDYRLAELENDPPDIIFSSLFCHHFSQHELVDMMGWMKANCRTGFFINDLQRHVLAYYSIQFITRLFSKSYLVKNDAPLSVARGFVKNDWQQICLKAGLGSYSIKWMWAFRYLLVCKK